MRPRPLIASVEKLLLLGLGFLWNWAVVPISNGLYSEDASGAEGFISMASWQSALSPAAWTAILQCIFPNLNSVELSHWLKISHREAQACGFIIIIINLFACMRASPARTHPCAFSLPFALACMTGKMSYKQIKIETQKRANYNMFNYLFWNHSSSLLYSVPGNVPLAIWQGHFFSPLFYPYSWVAEDPGLGEKSCHRARQFRPP